MKKVISLALGAILFLVLLTGCGNSEQAESNPERSSNTQIENISSSEAASSLELETSEQDIVSEESVTSAAPGAQMVENESNGEETNEMKMNVNVNGQDFTATLEQNSAVDALVQMMGQGPVTLQMSDYSGFEKVGPLGTSLPTSNSQTTTHAGDIVLYQGNQIVIFYGSNSWSYTRLGHIDDLTGWEEALGNGNVSVTFSLGG